MIYLCPFISPVFRASMLLIRFQLLRRGKSNSNLL
jgi:hypothetical protein